VIDVEPIGEREVNEVATFLHNYLNPQIPEPIWAGVFDWNFRGPKAENAGFLLRHNGQVVGVYGAVYTKRQVRGEEEAFCNLHSWCVREDKRSESMELVRALLRQSGLHFYNPTPNPLTATIFERLRFRFLDPRICVLFNVPRPSSGSLVVGHNQLQGVLGEEEKVRIQDHSTFPWIEQVAIGQAGRWCHLVFRKRRWKGVGCAEVLHIGDPDVFLEFRACFQRWLFLRRGLWVTHVQARFFHHPPSYLVVVGQPRMALTRTLEDADFLDLYTDQIALAEQRN